MNVTGTPSIDSLDSSSTFRSVPSKSSSFSSVAETETSKRSTVGPGPDNIPIFRSTPTGKEAAMLAEIKGRADQVKSDFETALAAAKDARTEALAKRDTMNTSLDKTSLWQKIFGYPVEVKTAINKTTEANKTALQKEAHAQEIKLSHDVLTAISNSNLSPQEQVTKYNAFLAAQKTAKELRTLAMTAQKGSRPSGRTERNAYDAAIAETNRKALNAERVRDQILINAAKPTGAKAETIVPTSTTPRSSSASLPVLEPAPERAALEKKYKSLQEQQTAALSSELTENDFLI